MTSADVTKYIVDNKVSQLYTKVKKYFDIIDKWGDDFIDGDLLNEYQLAHCLDQSTGIASKLLPIVNAFESYLARIENNGEDSFYKAILKKKEKVNAQAVSQAKAEARANASDVRTWLGDFKAYYEGASQNICSSQSRLKRLAVIKGASGGGFTGELPNDTEPAIVHRVDGKTTNDAIATEEIQSSPKNSTDVQWG